MISKINRKWINTLFMIHCLLFMNVVLTSCEKDLEVYDYPENSLNFGVTLNSVTGESEETSFSFVFTPSSVVKDTVWFTVNTQGFLTDYDRSFQLQQVQAEGLNNAVAGQHYVSFDSDEMRPFLVVPAGKNTVRVPVLVLRDASLEQEDVHLYFQIKENENFKQGLPAYRTAKLAISNQLSKPANWDTMYLFYYFCNYGPVAHRFMIETTGLAWDEEFISTLGDINYMSYLAAKLYLALQEENAARAARGEEPLQEADGTPVAFDFGAYYV